MDKIKIRITKDQNATLPSYGSQRASGLDIASSENVEIPPQKGVLVSTGLRVEIPDGFEAQIRPRSGLALKHSVTVLNTPGTIDSDYRGEVKVILFNHGEETFSVETGDRIAQMVICPVVQCMLEECDSLDETCRGAGGFGSTGV